MRIGFGFDVHQMKEGYEFWLGGIKISHSAGAVGHSDADVLIHAICDALLGAACLGDIGKHFPDTDPAFRGIDSKKLLAKVRDLISGEGFTIVNIDTTICLQKPKISTYIESMRRVLSEILRIDFNCISIKATTTEKLGFVGREEGISAYAITLLEKA